MSFQELHFALTADLLRSAERLLFPSARHSSGENGFIGLVTISAGILRKTLILHKIVEPQEGDVSWDSQRGLLFAPSYKSRAADEANAHRSGLIFVHTHPLTRDVPYPSRDDLDSDAKDLYFLGQSLSLTAPLTAGIVGGGRQWSVREYKFSDCPESAEYRFAEFMRVVGPAIRKHLIDPRRKIQEKAFDERAHDSSMRLWGRHGQEILGSLRVGLVGAGGVGSILAEHLPRLGVGGLVIADFDRLDQENRNRQQSATSEDIRTNAWKVEVAHRTALASATAPNFAATKTIGSVVEATTVSNLFDCDVILNAADSPWARQVLDQLAYAHLIPVINGGTELYGNPDTQEMLAGKCEVTVAGPGHPCFECTGVYTIRTATEAREHPDVRGRRGYLQVGDKAVNERSPSVISTNAVVAGLMQLRLQALALGTTPNTVVGTQRYHPLEGTIDFSMTRECKNHCHRSETVGLGELHELPLGIDRDFEVQRASNSAVHRSAAVEPRKVTSSIISRDA